MSPKFHLLRGIVISCFISSFNNENKYKLCITPDEQQTTCKRTEYLVNGLKQINSFFSSQKQWILELMFLATHRYLQLKI